MTGPRIQRRTLLLAIGLLPLTSALPLRAADQPPPRLMLAKVYRSDIALADYWVSEKYDGVRGYWDGTQLLTRGGRRIAAPAWFTAGWPAQPLDGELWAGRGRFEHAQSTVGRDTPDDEAWRSMRYMVFDLPAHPGTFDERLGALNELLHALDLSWVQAVPQRKVDDRAALLALLKKTVKAGGEGLMLHRGNSLYRGRAQRRPAQAQALRGCRGGRHRPRARQGQARRPAGRAAGADAGRPAVQPGQRLHRRPAPRPAAGRQHGDLPLRRPACQRRAALCQLPARAHGVIRPGCLQLKA